MTPLAQKLMRKSLLPDSKKTPMRQDETYIIDNLSKFICFEITQILPLAEMYGEAIKKTKERSSILRDVMFLPAPLTWIEYLNKGDRSAIILMQRGDFIDIYFNNERMKHIFNVGEIRVTEESFYWRSKRHDFDGIKEETVKGFTESTIMWTIIFLAVINSPKIIDRNIHKPHRGLCRDINRSKKVNGMADIKDWHEIILKVHTGPVGDSESVDGYVTGKRALHFCRSFLRIRRGQLEHVRPHWRGDSSAGISRATYSVRP